MPFSLKTWKSTANFPRIFNTAVDIILRLMAPLVILVLILGVVSVFGDVWKFLREGLNTSEKSFGSLLGSVLGIFVLIELFRSILEYFEFHRLKITLITEASLVFLLREVMIGVYQDKLESEKILALAALILVIGIIRTAAVVFSPEGEKKKAEDAVAAKLGEK